jgi:hypothetical protein
MPVAVFFLKAPRAPLDAAAGAGIEAEGMRKEEIKKLKP